VSHDKDQALRLLRALAKRLKAVEYVEDRMVKEIIENLTHLSIRLREALERQELDAAMAARKVRRRTSAPTRLHKVKREDLTLTRLLKKLSAAERERIIDALKSAD
jgi:hypothetical protein